MQADIDYIVGYHCAPVLRGVKIANLVSIPVGKRCDFPTEEIYFNAMLNEKDIYFYPLCHCVSRQLVLVFRRNQLERHIRQCDHQRFLHTYGYEETWSLEQMLQFLGLRLQSYQEFPHEIGIFLGYPLPDIESFIRNQGSHYLLCGDWKVYHNPERARKEFERFAASRRFCNEQLRQGKSIGELVA